jgi:hypothetical protein
MVCVVSANLWWFDRSSFRSWICAMGICTTCGMGGGRKAVGCALAIDARGGGGVEQHPCVRTFFMLVALMGTKQNSFSRSTAQTTTDGAKSADQRRVKRRVKGAESTRPGASWLRLAARAARGEG